MTTGQRMKARRKEIGLSAEHVAEILGVSPATIYRYENGDIEKVPGDRLEPIAAALQTTPQALMGWTESEKISPPKDSHNLQNLVNDDQELTEFLEQLRNRSEMRMLFSVSKNASKEDVEKAVAIIEALRGVEGQN